MFKILKYALCTLIALPVAFAASASDVRTVSGESTFYGESNHSLDDCRRFALEQARIAALAKEFGTAVTQDVYQRDMVSGSTESNYFSMLNHTEVNGEWLSDDEDPKYTVGLDADGRYVVSCKVKGKARRVTNEGVDFTASVLRNGSEKRFADTRFREGDDLKMYFRTPVNGYVAVYLIDDSRTVYSLLPYSNDADGMARVVRDRDYVFFDKANADRDLGRPDEFLITLDGEVEHNQMYVLFSPNQFTKALDSTTASNLPRTLSYDDFNKWLSNVRKRDPKMSMKVMYLEIVK